MMGMMNLMHLQPNPRKAGKLQRKLLMKMKSLQRKRKLHGSAKQLMMMTKKAKKSIKMKNLQRRRLPKLKVRRHLPRLRMMMMVKTSSLQ